jgi:hypothetical protein
MIEQPPYDVDVKLAEYLVRQLTTLSNQATFVPRSAPTLIAHYTTATAPAYVKGALYFDTTLNKLRVGGATAWETITSV